MITTGLVLVLSHDARVDGPILDPSPTEDDPSLVIENRLSPGSAHEAVEARWAGRAVHLESRLADGVASKLSAQDQSHGLHADEGGRVRLPGVVGLARDDGIVSQDKSWRSQKF